MAYLQKNILACILILVLLLAASCNNDETNPNTLPELYTPEEALARETAIIEQYLRENNLTEITQKSESGLYYIDLQVGEGPLPIRGAEVEVHYVASLLYGNRIDASVYDEIPFKFRLGTESGDSLFVVRGFDEGVGGMRRGGKRVLIIPSHLGYGAAGVGTTIPRYAILRFDVELIDF
ncbi:FKBP-type peptidyl-prolyl cis-trans isomerase [Hugenholtzia roseola]|uniref:FKBP-type peptidyl-prolyl cis-trans isomerase n=1 Tax=Hugenholtzia roseola TaxID=1002 RepID=UPI00040FE954|nr:FKBP-type peptidyl-prolyl cis-trans isomerase [Hugenholtzia roseola]